MEVACQLRQSCHYQQHLSLPHQFFRGSWQKRSASTYLTWCQRRNWVASVIELTLIFNPSYACHDMNVFWPTSFVKFPWHCWTKFSQSWNDSLRSHKNLRSLTLIISGLTLLVGFHSNSRDWLFWVYTMSRINPLMNCCAVLVRCVNSIIYLYKK